jgi:hemolysin activation/secretion protein
VGAALTGFKYRLGKQFEELDANGWEGIASLYGSYPLIRSYTSNLYLQADLDQRFFQDNIGAYSVSTDKRATVLTTSISGNQADGFGGGGWTDYSLASVMGDLSIESPAAREIDAVTAKTNGVYAKIVASVSRLQNIYGPLTLYVSARGQLADKNLDVSEKMELGGATGVRAYPEGEAYGDDGYIITIEPHLQLPVPPHFPGTLQAIAFVDTGYVKIYHTPFSNAQNGLTRTGAGVGLNWTGPYGLVANVTYADLLGDNKATSYPDNSGEIWFQIIKYF